MAKQKFVNGESDAVRYLNKIGVGISGKLIDFPKGEKQQGLKTWSAIDYLCNFCKYRMRAS